MRIKLDENVTVLLAEELRGHGHEVDTVVQEGLQGQSDRIVMRRARDDDRAVLTHDLHFGDLRRRPSSDLPPAVLLLRMSDLDPDLLTDPMRELLRSHDLNQWSGCLVVISERKVRVRRIR
jgi:predicted nuclease of predicted toxin-antitoxin system